MTEANTPSARILLTGASGFVGRAVATAAQARGHAVRTAGRSTPAPGSDGVMIGDLGAAVDWSQALAGREVVIHLAARVHVMRETASDPIAAFRAVNRDATIALANAALHAGVRRFVYISTIKGLGEGDESRPYRSSDAASPTDPYGRSKWEAEQALGELGAKSGLEVVIIRPPLVHGPGAGGNLRRLLRILSKGIPLPFASIKNRRAMVGVENLADLIVRVSTHPAATGRIFLVSDAETLSTPELIETLAEGTQRPSRLFPFPPSLLDGIARGLGFGAEAQRLFGSLEVDMTDTMEVLQWAPPVGAREGLRAMARAWVERPW